MPDFTVDVIVWPGESEKSSHFRKFIAPNFTDLIVSITVKALSSLGGLFNFGHSRRGLLERRAY